MYMFFFSSAKDVFTILQKCKKSKISNKKMTYGISVELHINAPSCFKSGLSLIVMKTYIKHIPPPQTIKNSFLASCQGNICHFFLND